MVLASVVFFVLVAVITVVLCKKKQYLAAFTVCALAGLVVAIITPDVQAIEPHKETLTVKNCDRWC